MNDVAGNTSLPQPPQGSFGPFEIDKKAPVISGPTISPSNPQFGQAVTANYSCTDGGSGVVLCGPSGSATIGATSNTGPLQSPADGSVGMHTFTVTAQDAVGNSATPSSVTYTVGQATPVINWTTPASIVYGTPLGAGQLDATANVSGTFIYSPAAGTVLPAGTQTLSVTFNPTDSTDYTTASATVQLLVTKATPTITWPTPAPITYGTPLSAAQLNATANTPGTFIYTPSAGTILKAGLQTLSVTFNPTDSTDYGSATASVQLTVLQAPTIVVWTNPASITYGTPLSSKQLNAKANVPGTFVYTPPSGTVLPPGTQILSVAFTPTDSVDYLPGTAQVSILVTAPGITFSPSSVNFGTVKEGKTASVKVTMSNPGNATLKINSIKLSGSEHGDCINISNSCNSIAAGGSCSFTVKLNASEEQTISNTILVSDNAPGSPQQIPVTGTVVDH